MVGRVMAPKEAHIWISGTCEYVRLHSKGDLLMQMKLRLLSSWLNGRESILDAPDGPKVITGLLTSGRGRQRKRIRGRCEYRREIWEIQHKLSLKLKLEEWAISQGMCLAYRSQQRQGDMFLLQRDHQPSCLLDESPVRSVLDHRPTLLWAHKAVLF